MEQVKILETGKIYDVRNSLSELTIEEFEYITHRTSSDDSFYDTWIDIFTSLDYYDMMEDIDITTFHKLIDTYNYNFENEIYNDVQKIVTIDNVDYYAYTGNQFSIKMRDLHKFQLIISQGFYYSTLLAYIYKRPDFTDAQNNDKEHLEYKKQFFKSQPASLLIPILNYLNLAYTKMIN